MDNNEKIYINNNSFEQTINKDISESNLNDQENIKMPKKIEDNLKINPQTLINRLKKELYAFNKNYEDKNPEYLI